MRSLGRCCRNGKSWHRGTGCIRAELRALAGLGHGEEALRRLEHYLDARPTLRDKVVLLRDAANELAAHGFPDAARSLAERELALRLARPEEHGEAIDRFELARAFFRAGRLEEARQRFEALGPDVQPTNVPGYLALIAAARGDREAVLRHEKGYTNAGQRKSWLRDFVWEARIAVALGEHERARSILREGFETGGIGAYDWLHADFEGLAQLFQRR